MRPGKVCGLSLPGPSQEGRAMTSGRRDTRRMSGRGSPMVLSLKSVSQAQECFTGLSGCSNIGASREQSEDEVRSDEQVARDVSKL